MSSWKIKQQSPKFPIQVENSFLNVSCIAVPMLHEETSADPSNPCPIVSGHTAHLDSPTLVLTEIRVFSFSLYHNL